MPTTLGSRAITLLIGRGTELPHWVTTLLERRYRESTLRGNIWPIPFVVWQKLPWRLTNWMVREVCKKSDEWFLEYAKSSVYSSKGCSEPSNGWDLSTGARVVLQRLLECKRPRMILEFGSGVSTVMFAQYASGAEPKDGERPEVWTIEHDMAWLDNTRSKLIELGLADYVKLIHAPLDGSDRKGRATYQIPHRVDLPSGPRGFDLCFIDGPTANVGRAPCLHLAAQSLRSGAIVALDDAHRPGEQAAWAEWLECYQKSLKSGRIMLTERGIVLGLWV